MKTEIQAQFKEYLEAKGYQPTTVKAYSNDLQEFIDWTQQEKLSVKAIQYKHLLELISYVRRKGRSKRNANKMLRGVDLYYRHLIEEGKASENPANGLRVKGATRRIPHDLVEIEDLEKMYRTYPSGTLKMQRNKTILSLIVHQALSAEELKRLEPDHLKLKEGKIYVPGAQRSNSRTLNLEAHQIIELQEYIQNTRPRLLEALKKVKHRKVSQQIAHLFFGMEGRDRINQITGNVVRKLKSIYPQYSKLTTNKIRESVITHWLKTKDVRIAQYMAGHRYASSTERYQETNLEDLKELLTKHHPLEQE
jgi:integrase/recombinase XerD